jgi:hypothetical protein
VRKIVRFAGMKETELWELLVSLSANEISLEEAHDRILRLVNDVGWVAVSERLPETNCYVLVHKSNGLIAQMSYHAPFDSDKRLFHWWGFGTWINQHSQVTHWMPMPDTPCR